MAERNLGEEKRSHLALDVDNYGVFRASSMYVYQIFAHCFTPRKTWPETFDHAESISPAFLMRVIHFVHNVPDEMRAQPAGP